MADEPESRNVDRIESDTWHVVLDTNEMFGDFWLRHREIQFLLEHAQKPNFHVCLPEVVIREMSNQFRERWSEARERYETALRDLERLIGRTISDRVQAGEIDTAAGRYEIELRRTIQGYGVHIEPIPSELAGVEALLLRDLGRRKPFGDRKITDQRRNRRDRGGMRDALIWESVLALCNRERRSLAIITDNSDDFANAQGDQLHEDLLTDLADIGVDRQNVRLYKTIKAFNDVHLRHLRADAPGQRSEPGGLRDDVTADADDASGPSAGAAGS
ncbi:MAG TPA: PIN domain-containing protein [Chloroflexota bacterium]|nr:PIN domain-containing protein [Chloroflexota bacterium]